MRTLALVCLCFTLSSLLWSAPVHAARRGKSPPPQPTVQPEAPWPLPAPMQIERFSLANGLRVVVQTDHRAPLVAVGLMVDVGSRDEQPGFTGLAHFFEHMMFQGSARVAKMEHLRALEAVGADLNATTSTDRTYYYEVVPKPALALALWLEGERFSDLAITQANVDNQRQAVLEERRERYENRPMAGAQLELEKRVFGIAALQHSVIGEADDIAKAPLAAFEQFWRTWYTPNNAVLCLSGDVTAAEARVLVEQYLGRLPRRAEPKHADFTQPPVQAHTYAAWTDPLAQTAAFHLAWRVPTEPHPDTYALDLLAEVLGGGEASRLHQKLVRERGLATSFACGGMGRRDSDVLDCTVEMAEPGAAALTEAKARVRREIADLALHGPGAEELKRAKVAFENAYVFAALSAGRRAELLAQYELWHGDARLFEQALPKYRAVTAADVQRVAQTWLGWSREVELDVLPKGVAQAARAGEKSAEVVKFEQALAKLPAAATGTAQ